MNAVQYMYVLQAADMNLVDPSSFRDPPTCFDGLPLGSKYKDLGKKCKQKHM